MRRRLMVALSAVFCLAVLSGGCDKTKDAAQPVKVVAPEGANEVRAVIGPAGGELHFAGKGAWFEIPKGVLQEEISLTLARVEPSFDLPGKDFVGKAYRIAPKITFAPGAARLYVPLDRELPGLPGDIDLQMYHYDKLRSDGPAGPTFVHNWQPQPLAKLEGFSQDQKHLVFWIYETIADRSTKEPFGLFQVGFNME